MTKNPDFLAEIHYLTTEQGGRRSYMLSGYFPLLKFEFSESLNGGKQIFLNKEIVYPGEDITAEIHLLSPEFFKNKLKKGLTFEVWDGKTVGTGKVLKVLNKDILAK